MTFYLNMTIPSGQKESYYMEILLPSNDGEAVMKFCGFNHRVHYQGLNFPHLNTPIETFEQDATSVREKKTELEKWYNFTCSDISLLTGTGCGRV